MKYEKIDKWHIYAHKLIINIWNYSTILETIFLRLNINHSKMDAEYEFDFCWKLCKPMQ